MKLSLSRWNNLEGSSRGVWIVDQVPGLVVLRNFKGTTWKFAFSPAARSPEWVKENPRLYRSVYYKAFRSGDRQRFALASWALSRESLQEEFPSRGAALLSLERELSQEQGSNLSEALDR